MYEFFLYLTANCSLSEVYLAFFVISVSNYLQ